MISSEIYISVKTTGTKEANKHLPKPPFTFFAGILEESLS